MKLNCLINNRSLTLLLVVMCLFFYEKTIAQDDDTNRIDTTQGNGLNNLNINFNFNFKPDLSNIGYIDKDRYEDGKKMEVLYESEPKKEIVVTDTIIKRHFFENGGFLWREKILLKETSDSAYQIITNKAYIQNMPDDEKAAIVFVLSFVENGCYWEDGSISMDDDKLICEGLSSLGFKYQHSPEQISFLKSWFVNDSESLKKIDACPRSFPGTTIFTTINAIRLVKNGDKIEVFATKETYNYRAQKSTKWTDVYTFLSFNNSIVLQKEERI